MAGSPSLRRTALDQLAAARSPRYADAQTTYTRTLQQRNSLLRAIREEGASRDELRYWDTTFVEAGGEIVAQRLQLLAELADPLAAAHAEIAPDEAAESALRIRYVTNAPALPGESPRDALVRRLAETADKEVWNGSTLVGPHRDDLAFELAGRDLAGFASRGQQRTAILAFKLAELDLLTLARRSTAAAPAGRRVLRAGPRAASPPRPPDRRAAAGVHHDDHPRRPRSGPPRDRDELGSDRRAGRREPSSGRRPIVTPRKRPMVRLGDLIPDAARALGLDDELRRSRAMATFEAIVAERVPVGRRGVPGHPPGGVRPGRRGGRSDRRPGTAAPPDRAPGGVHGESGRARRA